MKMTLKATLLYIKKYKKTHPSILLLVDWMLKNKFVDAAPKKKGWGLYGPTFKNWRDYID